MFERIIEKDIKLLFPQPYMAEELFELTEKNREFLREWLPWLDDTTNVEDTKAFIVSVIKQAADETGLQCAILYQASIAGMIGYHRFNKRTMIGEIGYWLSQDVNGKGIMTTCVREMINIGFGDLKLEKVEIHCAVGNWRSRALPERLGFRQEGVIRRAGDLYGKCVDLVVYGLLRNEWNEWGDEL